VRSLFKPLNMIPAILGLSVLIMSVAQKLGKQTVVRRSALCVTEGAVGEASSGLLSVDTTKMRAYLNGSDGQAVETHFTYLGETAEQSHLGSGETRQQFGLKLRAQNACNLVYAMWRFAPESRVVVSVKRNAGQSTSAQCGNRGYQNVKPQRSEPVPVIRPGDTHTLSAKFNGEQLQVSVDGAEVWEGDVGPEASDLQGPAGIRSDNVRLAFGLSAGLQVDRSTACKSGPEVSD
jgi:hypothetical protein